MKRFSALFRQLDETTSTTRKVAAMVEYFREVPPEDAAWAVWFLSGQRIKRLLGTGLLRAWASEASGYAPWLVEETYAAVGDLAETIALLLDEPSERIPDVPLHRWVEERILPLRDADDEARRARVMSWWRGLEGPERFILNKLLTGALRVGVSRRLVTRALSQLSGQDPGIIAHRMMGDWQPSAAAFLALIADGPVHRAPSTPYPFFLASPLESGPDALGPADRWQAEWKWDGIRAQLIRRGGACYLWSRGEEALAGRFPEIETAAELLPDGLVLDGEIVAWVEGRVAPFSLLQKRIGRRKPGAGILKTAPVAFLAYDLLETGGQDLRDAPLLARRARLEEHLAGVRASISLSPVITADSWDALAAAREESRSRGVEGLILKRVDSPYRVGRQRGDWWKWKVDPHTLDAVMIYAQAGHGRRSSLYTDYTLAVWADGETLVPIAKAYSGLDNAEIEELDRWIRRNTVERFGPVRSVTPRQVFEIAFEGINASSRHKSGVALRFPRISRWRRDLSIRDADRLEDVRRLLADHG